MTTSNWPAGRFSIFFATAVLFTLLQPAATKANDGILLKLRIVFEDTRDTVELTAAELDSLTQHTVNTHSPYYKGSIKFSGPMLIDVLASVSGQEVEDNTRISLYALNNYFVNTTFGELKDLGAIVATRKQGRRLSIRERGPYWIILPLSDREELDSEHFHRLMVWQLHKIKFGD